MDPEPENDAPTKTCPYCAETIKAAAIKCRFCGSDFTDATPGTPVHIRHIEPEPRPVSDNPGPAEKEYAVARSPGKSIVAIGTILCISSVILFWTVSPALSFIVFFAGLVVFVVGRLM